MISKSFSKENFYRFPRIDYKMLKKYNEGVISASACLGGVYAGDFWENREHGEDAVMDAMRHTTMEMMDIFGDRWYGELQWSKTPEQHILNKNIIQLHREFGIGLVSTADSHYPNPDAWKDRELYKRLGWLGKSMSKPTYCSDVLPASVDEITQLCLPYPQCPKHCVFFCSIALCCVLVSRSILQMLRYHLQSVHTKMIIHQNDKFDFLGF